MNNINVCVYPGLSTHRSCITLFFHGGLAYEEEKHYGITYLLERMFVIRLDSLDQDALFQEINAMGGVLTRATYPDFLCFSLKVSPQHFQKAIDLISKMLLPFQWTAEEIAAEKEVVIAQIKAREYQHQDHLNSSYFGTGKYAQRNMGSVKTIESITPNDLLQWKERIMNPSNMGVMISGNFAEYPVDYCIFETPVAEETPLSNRKRLPACFQNRTAENANHIVEYESDFCDVTLMFDIDIEEVNDFNLALLSSIMGEGDGSVLSMVLREQYAITDEIYSEIERYPKFSRLRIDYSVEPKNLLRILSLLFDILCAGNNIDMEAELKKNKVFFTDNLRFLYDDPQELNFEVGYRKFILKQKVYLLEDLIKCYDAVSAEDMQNTYQSVFQSKNMSVFISAPDHLEETEKRVNQYRKQMGASS